MKAKLSTQAQPTNASPSVSSVSTPIGTPSKSQEEKGPAPAPVNKPESASSQQEGTSEKGESVGPESKSASATMRQIGEEAAKRAGQLRATKASTGPSVRFQTDKPMARTDKKALPELAQSAGIPPPTGTVGSGEKQEAPEATEVPMAPAKDLLGSSGEPVYPASRDLGPKEPTKPVEEEKTNETEPSTAAVAAKKSENPSDELQGKDPKEKDETQTQSATDGEAAGISVGD